MRSSYVQFPEFLRVCLVVLKSKSNLLVSYYFAKHICRSYHFIFFIFFFYYQNLLFRCIMIGARLMIIIHERQKLTFSYACNGYFLLSLSFWKLVLFYFVCLHNILWTSNLSKISIMCCYLYRNLWTKAFMASEACHLISKNRKCMFLNMKKFLVSDFPSRCMMATRFCDK